MQQEIRVSCSQHFEIKILLIVKFLQKRLVFCVTNMFRFSQKLQKNLQTCCTKYQLLNSTFLQNKENCLKSSFLVSKCWSPEYATLHFCRRSIQGLQYLLREQKLKINFVYFYPSISFRGVVLVLWENSKKTWIILLAFLKFVMVRIFSIQLCKFFLVFFFQLLTFKFKFLTYANSVTFLLAHIMLTSKLFQEHLGLPFLANKNRQEWNNKLSYFWSCFLSDSSRHYNLF
jgi:hypothetical protein